MAKEHKNKIIQSKKRRIVSEETRKKIGEIHKGKINSEKTRRKMSSSWNYDKHFTKETREKLSKALKGKNNPMHGKHHNLEWKKEHSKIMSGKNNPMYGKHPSEETKSKMSERQLGKPKSESHKQKLREARAKQIFPVKDTSIEIKIQNFLKRLHIEFYTHYYVNQIKSKYQCDILIPTQNRIIQKIIIECDGCYWHGCPICDLKSHKNLKNQKERDKLRTKELQEKGFKVIRLWEHEIKVMELNDMKNVL